jgi:hypothetical protein
MSALKNVPQKESAVTGATASRMASARCTEIRVELPSGKTMSAERRIADDTDIVNTGTNLT